ncbi:MAG: response regulator [Bacteroidia bacterium]|nr:response regulator [Bacteroidia bacterium]
MFNRILLKAFFLLLIACLLPISKVDAQFSTADSLARLLVNEQDLENRVDLTVGLSKALVQTNRDSALNLLDAFVQNERSSIQSRDDKSQVEIWDKLADSYDSQRRPDKAKDLRLWIYKLSGSLEDQEVLANAIFSLGNSYSFLGKADSAELYMQEALEIAKKLDQEILLRNIYNRLGANAGRSRQFSSALEYYNKVLEINLELKDSVDLANSYMQLGGTHMFLGDYPSGLDKLLSSYEILKKQDPRQQKPIVLDMLSSIYETIQDEENNLKYLQLQEESFVEIFGEDDNPMLPLLKGKIAYHKGEYSRSIELLRNSLKILSNRPGFSVYATHRYLGESFLKEEEADSSFYHFQKSLEASVNTFSSVEKMVAHHGMGKAYMLKGNRQAGIAEFTKAYGLAEKTGVIHQQLILSEELYSGLKTTNPSLALQYLENSVLLKDSIFNQEKVLEIGRLESRFAFEQERQALLFEQEQEAQKQSNIRTLLIGTSLFFLLLLIVGLGYFRSKQQANKKLNALNQELSRQKEVVEAQNAKLSELDELKSRFFTNISHEFRTPLTIISGMIEQVKRQPELWLEKGAEMIKQNSQNLLNLVNQILELRKLESEELKPQYIQGDIISYLKYISESFESLARSQGIKLHFLPAQDRINMDYDPEKMLRIVSNLLSNAIKFTANADHEDRHVYLQITTVEAEGKPCLKISVKDTGDGILQEKLPYIFDRFYQVDSSITRKGEGTGIGLSLTRELVRLLKGEIEVESEFGKGANFRILLPITETSQQRTAEIKASPGKMSFEETPQEKEEKKNGLIMAASQDESLPLLLIVEDNPEVRQYLVACLQEDYRLLLAENGQEGIDKAIEQVPDLIVSDVMMPEKDGYQLCNSLKQDERTSHIPIILLTAKADTESKIEGLRKGADAYLAKPFERRELLIRLQKLFELRQKLQIRFLKLNPHEFQLDDDSLQLENEFMSRVNEVILEFMEDEEFGTASLAHKLGMSRAQVHNKIKALTGQPTSHIIRKIRLHKARHLLETTQLNISEIAFQVGFKNHTYFSRLFNEEFKSSPSQLRTQN